MICIALGANLPSAYGAPLETLKAAIGAIDAYDDIRVVSQSHIYKTAPVPISDQPWYHNAVISVETALKPFTLLAVLQEIEIKFGRVRDSEDRNAPRTLDLDIITYNDLQIDEAGLEIPHPRMSERAFVLVPMSDLSSKWKHPVTGASIGEMIDGLSDDQIIEGLEVISDDAA